MGAQLIDVECDAAQVELTILWHLHVLVGAQQSLRIHLGLRSHSIVCVPFCILQCEIDTEYPAVQLTLVPVIGDHMSHWTILAPQVKESS